MSIILIMSNQWQIQDFPQGGCAKSQNCYYFSNFCQKLHENEIIWTLGGLTSLAPPLDPPMQIILFSGNEIKFPKIEKFYEVIVPKMAPRHFRRYFQMYADTLNSIISYLALREPFTTLLDKG